MSTQRKPRRSLQFINAVIVLAVLGSGSLRGQPAVTPGATNVGGEKKKIITLYLGRSEVIKAPWMVKRISVTNPEVADVEALSPESVLLMGKSIGETDLFLWSETEELWDARVNVIADLQQFEIMLAKVFPGSKLNLTQSQEVIIVSGLLARAEHAQQLHDLLDNAGLKYVDMTSLAGVQQVQIKVRVAEVSRRAIRALGVNALYAGNNFFGVSQIGSAAGGALNPVSIGVPEGASATPPLPFQFTEAVGVSPLVTLFGGFPQIDLEIFMQALAENQYLRVLAEPTLVALSGEEASFLAGGEFPIPIVQGTSSGSTSISIEYKSFGVQLLFRPTVLGDGTIRLFVAPETSELSASGAVEIEGFSIPALNTRRASTTLELKSGQSFAMAGLLSSTKAARNSRVPILGSLPILGPLFRSVRYERGETELLVLVTCSLVEPLSLSELPPSPGSYEIPENDWEIFIDGSIEGKTNLPSTDPAMFKAMGLDRLKGPGAWADYK